MNGLLETVTLDTSNFVFYHSAWHQHVMSLKKSLGLSQNHGEAGEVLRPLFISKTALQHFEVLKSLNPLVKLLQMIFFLLGFDEQQKGRLQS